MWPSKWSLTKTKVKPNEQIESSTHNTLCSQTAVDFFELHKINSNNVIELYRCPEEPAFYAFWGYQNQLQWQKQGEGVFIPKFGSLASTLPCGFNDPQFREIVTVELQLVKSHVDHLMEVSWFQEDYLQFEERVRRVAQFVSYCLGGAKKQEELVDQWRYHSSLEQKKRGGPVVLMSQLRVGLSYHRALLFKALCQALGIDHCYIRVDRKAEWPSAETLVWAPGWPEWQKVDLCESPGQISPIDKSATSSGHMYRPDSSLRSEKPQNNAKPSEFSDTTKYPYLSYGEESKPDEPLSVAVQNLLQTPPLTANYAPPQSSGMYPTIGSKPIFHYSTAIHMDSQIDQQLQIQSSIQRLEPSGSQGAFGGGNLIDFWNVDEQSNGQSATAAISPQDEPEGGPQQIVSDEEQQQQQQQQQNSPDHNNANRKKRQLQKIVSDNYLRTEILKIPYHELKMIKRLGQGGFGEVHLAEWLSTLVAVKILFDNSEHVVDDFKQEVQTLGMLSHENVVQLRAVVEEPPHLSIVMEYVPKGSLFQVLHPAKAKDGAMQLPLALRLQWALDVAKGMYFLHYRNVEHRDLKTANLLLDRGNKVKITDFGLSKTRKMISIRSQPGSTAGGTGTPQYMAPEQMNMKGVHDGKMVDVYSYGVVLWELVTKQMPWEECDPFRIIGLVAYQNKRLDIPDYVQPEIKSLIQRCWLTEPSQRPQFEHIVEELNGIVPKYVQTE